MTGSLLLWRRQNRTICSRSRVWRWAFTFSYHPTTSAPNGPRNKNPNRAWLKASLELRDQFIKVRPEPWISFPGDTSLLASRAPSHLDMNNKAGTTGFLEILKRYNRKSLPSDALFHIYHRSRLNLPGNSLRFQYSSSWSQITIHSLFCTQPSVMDACILSSPNPLQRVPTSYLFFNWPCPAYHQDCPLFWLSWLLYPDSDSSSFCFLVHTTVYLAFDLQSGNKHISGQLSLSANAWACPW